MKITEREKRFLLDIARESIRSCISSSGFRYEPDLQPIISLDRPTVLENVGGYVSLYLNGELRGCVDTFNPNYPLFLVIRDMAMESAVNDKRFSPVNFVEFNDLIIEVTVVVSPKEHIVFNEKQFGIK